VEYCGFGRRLEAFGRRGKLHDKSGQECPRRCVFGKDNSWMGESPNITALALRVGIRALYAFGTPADYILPGCARHVDGLGLAFG